MESDGNNVNCQEIRNLGSSWSKLKKTGTKSSPIKEFSDNLGQLLLLLFFICGCFC